MTHRQRQLIYASLGYALSNLGDVNEAYQSFENDKIKIGGLDEEVINHEEMIHMLATFQPATARDEYVSVIFRMMGDEVIALFPGLDWDFCGHTTSYVHHGQHGGADFRRCMNRSRPATAEEYAPLKAELERIGYSLIVRESE